MPEDGPESDGDGARVLDRWVARKVPPIVVLYLLAVFLAFMALAYFAFPSRAAVKALALAAIGAVASVVPAVNGRIEYQVTGEGLAKRTVDAKKPRPLEGVFRWEELARIVPVRRGFKYYRTLRETSTVRRFWKSHVSDRFSGEVHVEKEDQERVLGVIRALMTPSR